MEIITISIAALFEPLESPPSLKESDLTDILRRPLAVGQSIDGSQLDGWIERDGFDVSLELGPTLEAVLTSEYELGVAQRNVLESDLLSRSTNESRQECSDLPQCFRLSGPVRAYDLLRALLQVGDVW